MILSGSLINREIALRSFVLNALISAVKLGWEFFQMTQVWILRNRSPARSMRSPRSPIPSPYISPSISLYRNT